MERDLRSYPQGYFYPRPPRGGRPTTARATRRTFYFYPRPPRGGRLKTQEGQRGTRKISIHALREEGDGYGSGCRCRTPRYFYPRPPRGGRPGTVQFIPHADGISIHALREEGDTPWDVQSHRIFSISIHALREEGDSSMSFNALSDGNFYPRPPRGGRRAGNISLFDKTLFLSTPSARRATS